MDRTIRVLSLVALTAAATGSSLLARQSVVPAGGAAPAGQGRPSQPAPPAGKGLIAGQVIEAESGRGVPSAVVRIGPRLTLPGPGGVAQENLSAYSSGMRYVIADAQGRFVIRNVPRGSYALVVQTPGYVLSAYGHQRPGGLTREIVLDIDQRVNDLVIKAWKSGVITGTVLDEAGEPAVNVPVRALRQRFSAGRPFYSSGFSTERTDDRGEYRIAGLDPGDYVVVVPSTSVTVPTAMIDAYRDATPGSAEANAISRDAAGLGAALSSPTLLSTDGYTLLFGGRSRGLTPPAVQAANAAYPTVFHPAAIDATDAAVVSLNSGEVRSGTDIRLQLARAFQVSGIVISPDGASGGVQVTLLPAAADVLADPAGYETATTLSAADGRFRFLGVPEGQYVITVTRTQRPPPVQSSTTSLQSGSATTTVMSVTASQPATASSAPIVWARVPLTVGGAHVNDVRVELATGARVRGQVVFAGASPPPAGPTGAGTISLVAADGRSLTEFPVGRPDAERRFQTSQYPPGRYYLSAALFGGKWSLKSITVGGRDALRTPFALGADDISDAVVTYTDRPAEVTVAVRDRSGAPADSATVALFPADYRAWIDAGMSARLLRVADAGRDGMCRFPEMLAGDYLVVAYPGSVARSPQDPAFIASIAAVATRVTVADGAASAVALTAAVVR